MINAVTRPRRILHCVTSLTFGGQTTLLKETISHLDPERFESFVCSIRPFSQSDVDAAGLGCPVLSLDVSSRYNMPVAVWRLTRLIKDHRIDLVHTQVYGTEREVFLAAAIAGVPVLGTLTTTYDPRLQAMQDSGPRLWGLRAGQMTFGALSRSSGARFVGLSEWVKESANRHLRIPEDRIDVVSVGLIPEEYGGSESGSAVRRELGVEEASPLLITVGRLSRVKAHAELLRAMPLIVEKFENARLLLVGDGSLREDLALLARELGVERNVVFTGRRDDVGRLLNASDMFVFTSLFEGVPHSVIEAMAAGKPVVAFDIPALREVVEHGRSGLLVKPRTPRLFAEAVAMVASDPGMAKSMAEHATQIVRERFDVRRNVDLLQGIYDRMLSEEGVKLAS